jgi:hypothetical protein
MSPAPTTHMTSLDSWARRTRAVVLAAAALVASPDRLHAQQSCLPAHDTVNDIVTWFLLDSTDAALAHGITATDAQQLVPLTDPGDAALCRRLDSAITSRPAYYLRAGSTIIATNIEPRTGGPRTYNRKPRGPLVFVFDTTGRFLFEWIARGTAAAPTDLHVASSASGPVVLAWTSDTSSARRYRLQRALGAGAFGDVDPSLLGNATTVADSATLTLTTYRYRLYAIGPAGDSTLSNEVSVTPGIFEVARTSSGLLYRDQFNRADGAVGSDWVAESGAWSVVGNALQIPIGLNTEAILRLTALANRKDFHIQVWNSRSYLGNYGAIFARRSGITYYLADLGSSTEAGGKPRAYRRTGGGYALLGYGTFASSASVMHRLTFSVLGTERRVWANGTQQVSATDATAFNDIVGNLSLNAYGMGSAGTVRFDDLIVCSARTITIAGLPAGFKLRVGGLTSAPATIGNLVTLDLLGTELPVAQIEILDGLGAVFKTVSPADGVWGGDRYSVNGAQ